MKEPGRGRTKRGIGAFLAVAVLVGIALLASGRLRGRWPFLVPRDRRLQAAGDLPVANQSLSFFVSPELHTDTSSDEIAARPLDRAKTARLADIEGIGSVYAEKLRAQDLTTTHDLLTAGASPKGREDLAAATGISSKLILRWVNQADLFRVKGVGGEYAELLEAAGVDTVPELAQRRADNLAQKMAEVNDQKKLVRRLPTQGQVAGWIDSARNLPRLVTY